MKVSAVLTAYNQAPYVAETLRSVLAQQRPADEIVVVDDGSTDETWGVVQAVIGHLAQARLVRQSNAGVAAARNRAVGLAMGDVVALLDGDDLWHPGKLAASVALLERHPEVALVADGVRFFSKGDAFADEQAERRFPVAEPTGSWIGQFLEPLLRQNEIPSSSQVCVRREALLQVGPSDRRLRVGSDYHLYLRLARAYPFGLLWPCHTAWRQRDGSASGAGVHRRFNWDLDALRALHALGTEADAADAPRIVQAARSSAWERARAAFEARGQARAGTVPHLLRLGWMGPSLGAVWLAGAAALPYRLGDWLAPQARAHPPRTH